MFYSASEGNTYTIPWEESWGRFLSWFNNDYVGVIEEDEAGLRVILVSPEGNRLALDWQGLPEFDSSARPAFIWESPFFTQLFYRTEWNDFALWDIGQKQIIWKSAKDEMLIDDSVSAAWSPHGDLIAFRAVPAENQGVRSFEWFILTSEGELQQRTDFSSQYAEFVVTEPIWAPDGNRFLFAFGDANDKKENGAIVFRPLIYDVASNTVVDFCLESYSLANTFQPWSPDGSKLALVAKVGGSNELVIIDLEMGSVLVLPVDICVASECDSSDDVGLTGILGWLSQ